MALDALGNAVRATDEAIALYDIAVDRSLRHDGGVADAARAATTADPSFAAAHALLALADPRDAADAMARARRLVASATAFERSLVDFVDALLRVGMWDALAAGRRHAAHHPGDLLGVGMLGTIVERSTRIDVHEAVLDVYAPSRRVHGDHPYLLCMVGFIVQEQGRFEEAGVMAARALDEQPTSVTAAHLLAHVRYETADHMAGLAWLDTFRHDMHPGGDYVHHLGWHAALHALELGDTDAVLGRLRSLATASEDDTRHVVDTSALLMRCRLHALLDEDTDPLQGRAAPPASWLREMPSMYLGFHAAVALAVAGRSDDLRRLAGAAPGMRMPGAGELLAPLAGALADYVDGDVGQATQQLAALRPTMMRWGGSRAQREVVEDILIDAAVRAGRADLATGLLIERVERRPSRWDSATLRSLDQARMWHPVPDDERPHH